ncbi:HSP90 family protein [Olivibacter sp. CPCC 100613]|uniref:HSP90 family protein n=1 Tax=Olivibacter sp. CPCC 100613 TaxID=3079931 RepID=UPI002FF71ADD
MMDKQQSYLFQVNLKGMISLLSEHLYSNPNTFVRELLQNGVDAITAIKTLDERHIGNIQIYIDETRNVAVFEDNGIGLKEDEIHKFIAVIGESSKREAFEANDFIGKFGIGLLSCFVVSNEIILETRSAIEDKVLRWTGKADGTYEIEAISEERPIGTRVILQAKREWVHLFSTSAFEKNLRFYGDLLPITITLSNNHESILINEHAGKWLNDDCTKGELLELGKNTFHTNFIDAFRIEAPSGKLKAVAYVLPYKTQFSGKQQHKLYLKRMFLSEDDCKLLPKWAFFIRCIINTDGLSATASRESLMVNNELKATQKEIAEGIKAYLKTIGVVNPSTYHKLISTHYLHLKAIAAEDIDLLKVFMDDLPFETNKGVRNFKNISTYQKNIYYTANIDDFKQLRRIAESQGLLVVNAAYTFEEELLKKIQRLNTALSIEEISPIHLLKSFQELDEASANTYTDFCERTQKILQALNCEVTVKYFQPADIPAIYIASGLNNGGKNSSVKASSNNPLTATLGAFSKKKETKPQLCFNASNKLIQAVLTIKDDYVIHSVVHILYVQSLLLGKYPVSDKEMNLFNEGLHNMLIMGIDNFINI